MTKLSVKSQKGFVKNLTIKTLYFHNFLSYSCNFAPCYKSQAVGSAAKAYVTLKFHI